MKFPNQSTGKIALLPGGPYEIDKTITTTGTFTIDGAANLPTIHNFQNVKHVPALRVAKDAVLNVSGVRFTGLETEGPTCNRAIHSEETGSRVNLNNVHFASAEGVHVWAGEIDWRGGTSTGMYAYGAYLGNHVWPGEPIARGRISGVAFKVGKKETSLRFGGFYGLVDKCSFDADTPEGKAHQKESCQLRHGRFRVQNCESHSWVIGPLNPQQDGDKHAEYAERKPTYAHVKDHSQAGYLEIAGNSFVAIEGLNIRKTDPRGVGNNSGPALVEKVHTRDNGQKQRPRVYVRNTKIDAYGSFADADFFIGPGCVFKGNVLPVSAGWSQSEFDRIVKVCDEAIPNWAKGEQPAPDPKPEPEPPKPDPEPIPPSSEFKISAPAGIKRIIIELD